MEIGKIAGSLGVAVAATFNFVPYIGSAVGIACVAAASLVTFPTLDQALAPPAVYLLLTTVEAYLVTPAVLSRRFTLNPVVVLIGLLFWGWIWGIPGALIAMPLVMTIKIVCDYVPSLATVGEFLSNREHPAALARHTPPASARLGAAAVQAEAGDGYVLGGGLPRGWRRGARRARRGPPRWRAGDR